MFETICSILCGAAGVAFLVLNFLARDAIGRKVAEENAVEFEKADSNSMAAWKSFPF